ncbi:MAG TPA: hypothetical protein VH743_21750 [Beijerinckiaceae bacterium]|jgi:hypothetical protein
MNKALFLGLAAACVVTSVAAQPRPSTVAMSCAQAAGLVASRGAIVLGTGGYTYDRFVAHRGFCLITEMTEPAWVPTRDTRQCFVGYRCKEAEFFMDR